MRVYFGPYGDDDAVAVVRLMEVGRSSRAVMMSCCHTVVCNLVKVDEDFFSCAIHAPKNVHGGCCWCGGGDDDDEEGKAECS